MVFRPGRRLLSLLVAVLFTIGSTGHVLAATEALMKMPAGTMESAIPDHDMCCTGDSDQMAHANCIAVCATSVAILSDPIRIPMASTPLSVESLAETPPAGRDLLPEPHPPRS